MALFESVLFCAARSSNQQICYNNGIMMKKLRGRNLAHFGCLLGITVGLTLGIIIAGVLASVFNVALNTVLFVWFGLTFGLGAVGWIMGDRLSSRFAPEEDADQQEGAKGLQGPLHPPAD